MARLKQNERGASMVEFAIVFPVFALLVFGAIEASAAFYARNTMGAVVSDSARYGSISGSDDAEIVQQIVDRADSAISVEILSIVIYKADGVSADPSEACRSGVSTAGDCIVYDVTAADAGSSCSGGWCPEDRNPDDLIGIWVSSRYSGMTGISPFDFDWTDRAVTLIEPKVG